MSWHEIGNAEKAEGGVWLDDSTWQKQQAGDTYSYGYILAPSVPGPYRVRAGYVYVPPRRYATRSNMATSLRTSLLYGMTCAKHLPCVGVVATFVFELRRTAGILAVKKTSSSQSQYGFVSKGTRNYSCMDVATIDSDIDSDADQASDAASSAPDPDRIEDYRIELDSLSWMSLAEQDAVVEGLPDDLKNKFFKAMRLLEPVACALASRRIAGEARQELLALQERASTSGLEKSGIALCAGPSRLAALPSELQMRIADASWCSTLDALPRAFHTAIARAALEDEVRSFGRLVSASRLFHDPDLLERMAQLRLGWVRRWLRVDGLPDGADVPLHGRRFYQLSRRLHDVMYDTRDFHDLIDSGSVYTFDNYLMLLDGSGNATRSPVFIFCGTEDYAKAVVRKVAAETTALTIEDDHYMLDLPDPPRDPGRSSLSTRNDRRVVLNTHALAVRLCEPSEYLQLSATDSHCLHFKRYGLQLRCTPSRHASWLEDRELAHAGIWVPQRRAEQGRRDRELLRTRISARRERQRQREQRTPVLD
jgi:hypothetical protein